MEWYLNHDCSTIVVTVKHLEKKRQSKSSSEQGSEANKDKKKIKQNQTNTHIQRTYNPSFQLIHN